MGTIRSATNIPTSTPLSCPLSLFYPTDGTVIYAETLHVSGVGFVGIEITVQVVDIDSAIIIDSEVLVDDKGQWEIDLQYDTREKPVEVTVLALANQGTKDKSCQDSTTVILAGPSYRPDGVFGTIHSPPEGSTVGGDLLEIKGTVSGITENTFWLEIVDEDGLVIDHTVVTVSNPNHEDEIPWTAEIATNRYVGTATIRAFTKNPVEGDETLIGRVNISIGTAAG